MGAVPHLIGAALLILLTAPVAAQNDERTLLDAARARILENIEKIPKYTCVQTVHRSRFEVFSERKPARCGHAIDGPRPMLAWRDRFKLDVTVSDGREIFSWVGAREFHSSDAQEIVGGGLTGAGDFGPFLTSIFGSAAAPYEFEGRESRDGREFAVYRYHVPLSSSRYQMKLNPRSKETATLSYEGRFWIDVKSAELSRMTILVPEPPARSETCRVETAIDYEPVQIGGSRVVLPRETVLQLWDADGARHENRIKYSGCRAFQSESVFRTDLGTAEVSRTELAPSVSIPPGLILQIALRAPVKVATAFAGDAVEGVLLQSVQRGGRVLVPQGAVVHGRIVRSEQHEQPSPYLALGIKFESVSVNGGEAPLFLEAVSRSRGEQILTGPEERRQGIGMFVIRNRQAVLDRAFVSEWKTRSR